MSNTTFPDAASTWDGRYKTPGFLFGTTPNAYLARHQELFTKGKRVLAVADGEGRNSVWLAKQGLIVDAFDISSVAVEKAKKFAESANVSVNFHVADCDSWEWKEAEYDYVVAIFVQFANPAMRERLFANMAKTLKPGGFLLLQGYTPKQLSYKTGGPPCLDHLYTEEMLQSSFRDLEICELQSYGADIQEGSQHQGLSALIGLIGKKPESS